ncbi:hypothetical protein [Accumulibacter sp.]|uniref:hypothetical protein n=1 Tax=Accumulibacter sp. TaxID=2053492 RepID=UPI0025D25FC2|nr:hypothetical protein [Accumulibacter sp.]MCM8595179.1 hypothetical protein [Accumulibacter sp.]MCM8625981.1 hypothetical protein [Accumulibacter sp.]MDS4049325.1 hypothetical protein [Accumulibacter sp.]
MPTANNLRKLLHRKAWELCTPCPSSTVTGAFLVGDKSGAMPANDCVYAVFSASTLYHYHPEQDAWVQIPASGVAGTFAAGACGEFLPLGLLGGSLDQTATAGTTTSLSTSRTIVRDLRGCKIRVLAGTGAGYEGTVASNTLGANAVLTVTPASAVAFDASSVFRVWSGSLWFWNAGTSAVGFSVYDRATHAWTAKSVTGMPTAWGTSGQLVSTSSAEGAFETGTSTGSNTATTLNHTGKTWLANAWTNAQVRLTGGTGAGQVRTVASNTASSLTLASAWTVTPDATSAYSIEGNDDVLYLLGNGAVTLYRYSISGNTWSTLSPGTARSSAPGAGFTADWIHGVPDPDWSGAQGKLLLQNGTQVRQNGRYLYSLRGGGSANLEIYDIAGNTWLNVGAQYGNAQETFSTGSCSVDFNGAIYVMKEATGRIFRFDVARNVLEPWSTNVYPQSTAVEGDKLLIVPYRDGATVIPFLYCQPHSRNELQRMMVIG